ncbi:MAG TPA: hypothetical protein VM890_09435 [Longimicrobium sp.]|nr:hypothetical protein [Longimicrobium sp.]
MAAQSPCGSQAQATGCVVAFQALASGAPQLGIAAAGGSAVPGVEGTRGVTLGIVPKTSASLRLSAARVRLPDLDDPQAERSLTPIALKLGTATRLFEGGATGLGALDLLLEAGILTGTGEGGRTAAVLGAGARLGLLRETFGMPGVALSGTFRHTGPVRYGEACILAPGCGVGADGEASFGVNDLSARLTVGKRVGPVGVLGGAGWDRFSTTRGFFAYQGNGGFEPISGTHEVDVHDSRWSAFASLSYGLTVGSLVAEAGWMGGGSAVDGYTQPSGGYDPGQGTLFGSIALRVQL